MDIEAELKAINEKLDVVMRYVSRQEAIRNGQYTAAWPDRRGKQEHKGSQGIDGTPI